MIDMFTIIIAPPIVIGDVDRKLFNGSNARKSTTLTSLVEQCAGLTGCLERSANKSHPTDPARQCSRRVWFVL